MSSQEVVDFIRKNIYEGKELSEIGGLLCNKCLAENGNAQHTTGIGSDNMTVVIVAILHGRTKEEWYSWIHDLEAGEDH
jgi:protein phosphatase PTC2/3